MRKPLFVICSCFLFGSALLSCRDNVDTAPQAVTIRYADTCSHKTAIHNSIINFLHWYEDYEKRKHRLRVIKGGYPDGGNYFIDTSALEKYLAELGKSGYLSRIFLDKIRQHYIAGAEYLKSHPQNDGPIESFEGDDVMLAQDYADIYLYLNNAMIRSCQEANEKAFMRLSFSDHFLMRFYLTNHNDRWQIDSLRYE